MAKSSVYNHIGKKYNKLTILSIIEGNFQSRRIIALCDCGNKKEFLLTHVRLNKIKSCGCLHKEKLSERRKIHGLSEHPLYSIWGDIKTRCYNSRFRQFKNYGGRGVIMCEEWKNSFAAFYDWCVSNGWVKGLDLDKDILGDGLLYSPKTCCFVTRAVNNRAKYKNRILRTSIVLKVVAYLLLAQILLVYYLCMPMEMPIEKFFARIYYLLAICLA